MVAVAVLVVIAIAGIVLASLRGQSASGDAATAADATQATAAAMTAAASGAAAAEAAAGAGADQIVFAPLSAQLSEAGVAKLARVAEAARKENRTVVIASKIEARADRVEQMELAKKRAFAVRLALEAKGVQLGTMRIEIGEMPTGLVTAGEANRVDVALR